MKHPRRSGQVITRGERKHLVRIYLGRDGDGGRHYFNHTVHGSKRDAEQYLREALTRKDLGLPLEFSYDTLAAFLKRWLDGAAAQRLRPHSLNLYRETIDRYIIPKIGNRQLSLIGPGDLQDFCHWLVSKVGLGPRTVRTVFTILSGAFSQATKWNYIRKNPVADVQLPQIRRREMLAMSGEEAGRFLEAAILDPYYVFFAFLLETGSRPSEALGLKWADVDRVASTVTIQRGLHWSRDRTAWHLSPPKTPKSVRTIPLRPTGMLLLAECRRVQNAERLKAEEWKNHGFVFTQPDGRPLSPQVVRLHFKRALKAAGLKAEYRLYDLRHSMATLLAGSGINPKVVAERLGHSNINTTLEVYTHVTPGMQREASELLEKVLYGETGTP